MLRIIKKIARCVKQPADVELLLVMSAYNRDRIFPLLKAMRPMTLVTAEQEQLLQTALRTEGAAMQMRVARAVLDNKSLHGRGVWERSANLVKQVCWANLSRYDLTVMPNLVEALRTMCSLKLIEPALRPMIYGMIRDPGMLLPFRAILMSVSRVLAKQGDQEARRLLAVMARDADPTLSKNAKAYLNEDPLLRGGEGDL